MLKDIELSNLLRYEIDKPDRWEAFIITNHHFTNGKSYWATLADIWVMAENGEEFADSFPELFSKWPDDRHYLMDEDDLDALHGLPVEVKVYRGEPANSDPNRRWSWSTNHATAEWFAHRWALEPEAQVVHGLVNKRDVIAFLIGRDENEIIVDPDDVEIVHVQSMIVQLAEAGGLLARAIQTGVISHLFSIVPPDHVEGVHALLNRMRKYGLDEMADRYQQMADKGIEIGERMAMWEEVTKKVVGVAQDVVLELTDE